MKKIIKSLYNLLPLKYSILKFIKLFGIPQGRIRNALRFNGIVNVELESGESFDLYNREYTIESEFFWLGKTNPWEKESLKIWQKLCANKSTIFDIGANSGVYSLIAKTVNPNCSVFAFEPQPNIYNSLKENNNLNKFDIHCEQVALSDSNGEANFFNYGDTAFSGNTTAGSLNQQHRPNEQHSIIVKCQTLANYIESKKITNIDLIKLDVETHEIEVLNGMGNYLEKFKPTILIEIIDSKIGDKLHKMFSNLNYKFFYIDDVKGVLKVDNLKQREYNNYILTQFEL